MMYRLPLGAILRTLPIVIPGVRDWALPRFLSWVDGQDAPPADNLVGRVIAASLREFRPALPLPSYFTDNELQSISVPALAVIAGRSVMHRPQAAYQRARTRVPGIRAELWPQATHAVSGQFAAEINTRLLAFVDSLGPGC